MSYWYMWAECERWIRDVSDLEFESFLPMPAGVVRPVKINPGPQFVLLAMPEGGGGGRTLSIGRWWQSLIALWLL